MAQGSIRIRCKVCRAAGVKDGYMVEDPGACKHKERVFQVLIPQSGQKPICKTLPTITLAQKWRNEIINQLNKGIYNEITPFAGKDIVEKYLARKKGTVRPGVYTHQKYIINKHILPRIQSIPISKVTESIILDIENSVAHQSYSLKIHIRIQLKCLFKFAARLNAINKNVTDNLEPIKKERHRIGLTKKKREVVLTNAQIHQLIGIAEDPLPALYYEMGIYTGMRPNELVGVPISEINLDKAQVHVAQTLYWYQTYEERGNDPLAYKFQPTKSTAGDRIIGLTPSLVKNIQIYLINATQNKHELLFARPNGDPINHQNDINEAYLHKHLKLLHARYEFPLIDFYTLRHNYAAILCNMQYENGQPMILPIQAKYLMGHEDIQTTMNVYAKIRPDLYGNVVKDLGKKLEAFTANDTARVNAVSI